MYWIKTKRYKNMVMSAGRYEFHEIGRDLGKAVRLMRALGCWNLFSCSCLFCVVRM